MNRSNNILSIPLDENKFNTFEDNGNNVGNNNSGNINSTIGKKRIKKIKIKIRMKLREIIMELFKFHLLKMFMKILLRKKNFR